MLIPNLLLLPPLLMHLLLATPARAADRPMRYHPDHGDYEIVNGTIEFNRPLYPAHTAGAIEAGDRPEFALCLPTKGGVLRLGIAAGNASRWLIDCNHIVARYRAGSEIYDVNDPLLPAASLHIEALPMHHTIGLVLKIELTSGQPANLIWAYGGGTGERSRTHFDLTATADPTPLWSLKPQDCAGAAVIIDHDSFSYTSRAGVIVGNGPPASSLIAADAAHWDSPADLLNSSAADRPVVVGVSRLSVRQPVYLTIGLKSSATTQPADEFTRSSTYRQAVAERVTVDTPDPSLNAMPPALSIAADDIWQPPTFMHGANAWHVALLGWRGPYSLDALSWHDRAAEHLSHWASLQNTADDFPAVARADPAKHLAENDWVMLHSNGNIPQTHYDMNLAFIDALFRHLLWTGDRDFAKKMWPAIARHLAWEKRCFDRGGLYEAYACIWASDALEYNGGGAAHSSAYNYFHNQMAAKVARWIGQDPAPYEAEANRIKDAMQQQLWLPQQGWYAEYKDLLGLQRVHPDAALWTIYHAIDCRVPDDLQTYQCLRYVTTRLPHIAVRGPGVPDEEDHVLATTDWQPYEWSLNNVCMGENSHAALAYWQAGDAAEAWRIFKGALLDAQYMGLCPGDFPNLSFYDANRGESYRDFGDTVGITSRALIEGLFGIQPDAIAGELTLQPGFPPQWNHASIFTPDLKFQYTRSGSLDRFVIEPHFPRPMALRLIVPARADHADVRIDGQAAERNNIDDAVGHPRLETRAQAADKFDVEITWTGSAPASPPDERTIDPGAPCQVSTAPAQLLQLSDPQNMLSDLNPSDDSFTATIAAAPGHHTAFAHVSQGEFSWWMPINVHVPSPDAPTPPLAPITPVDRVDLTPFFNDKVTQIFKNQYLSPRTPFCSLQIPVQGIGNWTSFRATADIDDAGLRRSARADGLLKLPGGLDFMTPSYPAAKNVIFTSRWDNYPREISVPLSGTARHAYLLMAGSTNPMETDIDNGEVVIAYADGSTRRVALRNPTNWWPIEQDYPSDNFQFRRPDPAPLRVCLGSGAAYVPRAAGRPPGGAATVIDFPLDSSKTLRSLTCRTLSNTVVVGLMAVTLEK